jgi:hypothetical protein
MVLLLLVALLGDEPRVKPAPLMPRWVEGQETVYRGTVKDVSQGQAIQLQSEYQLEVRLLVLAIKRERVELACLTKLTPKNPSPGASNSSSVHLTQCTVDSSGKVLSTTAASGPNLVLDGPATWESAFLLPPPAAEKLMPGLKWELSEPGRLPRRCTLGLPEPGQGEDAWVVRCEQESIDWQQPRGDTTAWRRMDRVSYSPRYTLPRRVERTIQRRAPAQKQVSGEIVTEYEIVRQDLLEGPMLVERRRDVQELLQFRQEFDRLAPRADEGLVREGLGLLEKRLIGYLEAPGRTPYRETVLTLRVLVEAAMTGRLVNVIHQERSAPVKEGEFAPDFRLPTVAGEAITLKQFRGRPCLLVFVRPETGLTKQTVEELSQLHRQFGEKTFTCLMLAVNARVGELPMVKHTWWKTLDGRTEAPAYGVTETPHLVLLDVDGAVLKAMTGWGPEIRQTVEKLVRKELAKVR